VSIKCSLEGSSLDEDMIFGSVDRCNISFPVIFVFYLSENKLP
jgi:hypothetical protein